jgi:transposase InsO family protein
MVVIGDPAIDGHRRRRVRQRGTLECELLDRRRFRSHVEARMAVFDYLEGFYHSRRRHSALDYKSPSSTKLLTP